MAGEAFKAGGVVQVPAELLGDAPGLAADFNAYLRKTHVVQPWCGCGDGPDGWDVCAHADDEGLTP